MWLHIEQVIGYVLSFQEGEAYSADRIFLVSYNGYIYKSNVSQLKMKDSLFTCTINLCNRRYCIN